MTRTTKEPVRKRFDVFMFPDIKAAIDKARRDQPRSIWIENAALEKLERDAVAQRIRADEGETFQKWPF